jgi:hypothetical protein
MHYLILLLYCACLSFIVCDNVWSFWVEANLEFFVFVLYLYCGWRFKYQSGMTGYCIVCPSIYGFWLLLWCLQTFFNYLLWKESLMNDGQHFNQYEQNEQPPPITNNWTQKRPRHITLKIQDLALARQKIWRDKPVIPLW